MFLDRDEISVQLDIKDPFLMIDEIRIDISLNKAKSLKLLNKKEWFFFISYDKISCNASNPTNGGNASNFSFINL